MLHGQEFKFFLPPLDSESYHALEENLLQHGVRDAIVLWNNILIDGHNRYEIATRHGLAFDTVSKDFGSRAEVLIWMVSTQVGRRNLSPMQLSYFRGRHYQADKLIHGRPRTDRNADEGLGDKSGQAAHFSGLPTGSTARRLSEKYKVDPRTIRRDAAVRAALRGYIDVLEVLHGQG